MLLFDFVVHRRDRAIHDFFFFLNPAVLINADDFIRDLGGELRTGIVNADLKKIGVANLVDVELASQHLVSDLTGRPAVLPRPSVLQLQLINDGIKNSGSLNDLINRRRQLRIVNRLARIGLTENPRILSGGFYFHDNVRAIFAGLEISENRGGYED